MKVSLISVTPDAEATIAYCARVSNPANQDNPEYSKLIAYCIKHKHWSILEHAHMTVEITTSRAIAAQILRHRSATFQEFSQRYSTVSSYEEYEARSQDPKNKQNSVNNMSQEDKTWFKEAQKEVWDLAYSKYTEALSKGVAKEQARNLLPLNTSTTLYMTNNLRNWIHYIQLRSGPETQQEHRDIALAIQQLFIGEFPVVSEALGWK